MTATDMQATSRTSQDTEGEGDKFVQANAYSLQQLA
jgi:hypothetical protein